MPRAEELIEQMVEAKLQWVTPQDRAAYAQRDQYTYIERDAKNLQKWLKNKPSKVVIKGKGEARTAELKWGPKTLVKFVKDKVLIWHDLAEDTYWQVMRLLDNPKMLDTIGDYTEYAYNPEKFFSRRTHGYGR